eukprot:gene17605-23938_t
MPDPSAVAEAFKLRKVCIVGGGNAAHAMAALFPFKGIPCNMLATYGDEADRINAGLDAQGHMEANFDHHNSPGGLVTGRPDKVSKSAADVVPECNVIIMPLPSFAYRPVLEELKPHLKAGMYIGVTPGQGGFDWIARDVLGDLVDQVVFFAIMPMPFNCRITEFGKKVAVQEFKRHYRVGTIPATKSADAISICEQLFGYSESCGHFLSTTLYPINAIIHPQRLYALCNPKGRDPWTPGKSFPENPLFYENMDDFSAEMMDVVNKELIQISAALQKSGMEVDVPHIFDFLAKFVYEDAQATDLKSFFAGNAAYKGFRCPFKQIEGGQGWEPDFQNRYFTEDIPFGLCIYKGVADIAGVATPHMDSVLTWVQGHMGKEYVVDGKLKGKDVGETNAPQRWGITTVEGLQSGGGAAS